MPSARASTSPSPTRSPGAVPRPAAFAVVLLGAGLLLLSAAGCSDSTAPPTATVAAEDPVPVSPSADPTPTATGPVRTVPASPKARAKSPARTTAPPSAGSGHAGLDRFVAAVQREIPEVALDRRDEEIGQIAVDACGELAAGARPTTAVAAIRDEGIADADARKLLKLAQQTVCRT